jgi:hypothetical protein
MDELDAYTLEYQELVEDGLFNLFQEKRNDSRANVASLSFTLEGPFSLVKGMKSGQQPVLDLIWFKKVNDLWILSHSNLL